MIASVTWGLDAVVCQCRNPFADLLNIEVVYLEWVVSVLDGLEPKPRISTSHSTPTIKRDTLPAVSRSIPSDKADEKKNDESTNKLWSPPNLQQFAYGIRRDNRAASKMMIEDAVKGIPDPSRKVWEIDCRMKYETRYIHEMFGRIKAERDAWEKR